MLAPTSGVRPEKRTLVKLNGHRWPIIPARIPGKGGIAGFAPARQFLGMVRWTIDAATVRPVARAGYNLYARLQCTYPNQERTLDSCADLLSYVLVGLKAA